MLIFLAVGLTDFLKNSPTVQFCFVLFCFFRTSSGCGCEHTVCLTCDEVVHQCDGDAEDADQQVADGQVKNEEVDYGAHVAVLYHDEADQHIPHHAQQEDE